MRKKALLLAAGVLLLSLPHSYADEDAPRGIVVKVTGAGRTLTDTKGMTLYTYDKDPPGKSTCNDGNNGSPAVPIRRGIRASNVAAVACSKAWPPLLADNDAKPVGEWSPIARDDGAKQWAWHGKPLYTFAKDTYPGASVGDDVQLLWHVAFKPTETPREITIFSDVTGAKTLADVRGLPLYARDNDNLQGKSSCTGSCAEYWRPIAAPAAAKALGDWSVIARSDGLTQWAYKGKPLYSYSGDVSPGETSGEGIDKIWHAVVLDPGPGFPSWMTVKESDYGLVLADSRGMTLYGFQGSMERVKQITCDQDCIRANMPMVPAAADAKPAGNWSPVPGEKGTMVWAYKGNPVYTFVKDSRPGDIKGDKFASAGGSSFGGGGWWRPFLRSCICAPMDAGG